MMATMSEQFSERWATARQQLDTARAQLTNSDDEELQLYEHFLRHNELGLALDALVDVATAQRAPGGVWRALSDSARTMELEPNDSVHGPSVQRILDHLAAAHDLRGLQRLLNEWDPIGVRPESGGPDDESRVCTRRSSSVWRAATTDPKSRCSSGPNLKVTSDWRRTTHDLRSLRVGSFTGSPRALLPDSPTGPHARSSAGWAERSAANPDDSARLDR